MSDSDATGDDASLPKGPAKPKKPKAKKTPRPTPRVLRGFRDLHGKELRARWALVEHVRAVYERFGFEPWETPAIEYVDCLGKFLPEANEPDAGIFAWQDEDEAWVALRYDLTAPLSRMYAQNVVQMPRPFRRYQVGPVYRTDKPGPGRFREFVQFDADIVGASTMMADAEIVQIMCEALEGIGIPRGEYAVRINNRKVLSGVLETAGIDPAGPLAADVLRTLDKFDKVGWDGVRDLLTKGRLDASGAFIRGLELPEPQVTALERYFATRRDSRAETLDALAELIGGSLVGSEGVAELREIAEYLDLLGLDATRVQIDPTIVRGLAYYTGPVFEAVLTREIVDEDGQPREFGTVMSGGRYDDLIKRFTGQEVPATGCSMGVDRMIAALAFVGELDKPEYTRPPADVLVTVMDKSRRTDYLVMANRLREAGLRVDIYMGNKKIDQQLRYADQVRIRVALIAGGDEFERGTVQLKDLYLGEQLAGQISDREEWRTHPAQQEVPQAELVERIRAILSTDVPGRAGAN